VKQKSPKKQPSRPAASPISPEKLRRAKEREFDGSPPVETVEPEQIEDRAGEFGLTAEQLRLVIQRAGPAVEDIRAYLRRDAS